MLPLSSLLVLATSTHTLYCCETSPRQLYQPFSVKQSLPNIAQLVERQTVMSQRKLHMDICRSPDRSWLFG